MFNCEKNVEISSLGHTWILDLDGSIVKHNGYKIDGRDTFLEGAKEFLQSLNDNDMVIFITSRSRKYATITESFLKDNEIKYDNIIYEAPYGERFLINDDKPTGLKMAYSFNLTRDNFCIPNIKINNDL